ncbi:hypothetical protein FOL47_000861 [Perkinsus chesapeaki]|uniref:K Homology domain-containing protein n=1 Tax=Perkinsus chesapeaki TaxID=330153 RepID=A0A7J6MKY2_PERCH|nr:hypothetical protein FOL47_000861 [Perkinsus chesapeaki]
MPVSSHHYGKRPINVAESRVMKVPRPLQSTSVSAAAAAALAAAKGLVNASSECRRDVHGNPIGLGALAQEQITAEMTELGGLGETSTAPQLFTAEVTCHKDLAGRVIGSRGTRIREIQELTSCRIHNVTRTSQPSFTIFIIKGSSESAVERCVALVERVVAEGRQTEAEASKTAAMSKDMVVVIPGSVKPSLIGPSRSVLRAIQQDSSTNIVIEKTPIAGGVFEGHDLGRKYCGYLVTVRGADDVSLGLAFEYIAQVVAGRYPIDLAIYRWKHAIGSEIYQNLSVEESLAYRTMPIEWLDYCLRCTDAVMAESDLFKRSELIKYICHIRESYFISTEVLQWARLNHRVLSRLAEVMTEAARKAYCKVKAEDA